MATLNATNLKHASSTSNNIVLNADGSTTIASGVGKILQVVQTLKTDSFSQSVGAQNASSVCMSVNITPTSATNKLLIKAVVHMSSSSASNSIGFNFSKDGTEQPLADADGNRIRCTGVGGNERNYYITPLVAEYLVTAGGTSQQTWGVMLRSGSGGTQTIKLNRSSLDDNGVGNLLPVSSITIYEVAA
jgi:hypothetical protein|tara:strand:- start:51 stop:617 length:567 start_codon:yes stop_codon:yes gene_type:complete